MKRYIKGSVDQRYKVIKTSKWWDPEGLQAPHDPGRVQFQGSHDDCAEWLADMCWDSKHSEYAIVEEYVVGSYLQIYYPYAIARAQYTIVQED